ncbi:FecR family protein, partial [Noviherbaspirillum sp. ST9]
YTLIIDDLEGVISSSDKLKLEKWRSSSPARENIYQEFCQIDQMADLLSVRRKADVDRSWQRLNSKLIIRSSILKWSVTAAACVLLCVCYYLYSTDSGIITVSTSVNQQKKMVLPDGTIMDLNHNTTVEYSPEEFSKDRSISLLKGEAFFNVKHDPANVFSLNLGDVKAIDLGTAFNVSRSGDDVNIVVQSGTVEFVKQKEEGKVVLNAGMQGRYLAKEKKLADTPNVNANYKAWTDKKLVFINSPLPYVIDQLEKTYHTSLILKGGRLKNRKFTANLHYQTIDSALVIISATLHCK